MKTLQKVLEITLAVLTAAMILCAGRVWRAAASASVEKPVLVPLSEFPAPQEADIERCRLDLNTANAWELESLPGIGTVRAEHIITWREENGGFSATEDILSVSGIGDATYERILPYITVR